MARKVLKTKDIRECADDLLKEAHTNLLWTLDSATESQYTRGLRWYDEANAECYALSSRLGIPFTRFAGLVSALSPQMRWEDNINAAFGTVTDPDYRPPTYGINVKKAERILKGEPVEQVLNGPKTIAFYRCILDPWSSESVAIDRHQIRLLYPLREDKERQRILNVLYAELEEVHREVAGGEGMRPHEVQAITWLVQREQP